MVDRGVYTLRGWLAFVAFLDFAQALRSWRDKDIFLGSFMCVNSSLNCTEEDGRLAVPPTTARLLVTYSTQNAVILLMCAFCIHHWPMALMTVFSLVLKIAYFLIESLKLKSAPFNFHIIFPVVVHGITLIALFFSPKLLKKEILNGQENDEILKMCSNGKPICLPTRKKKS